MVAFDISPLPYHLEGRRINTRGTGRAERYINAAAFDNRSRRCIGIEWMRILWLLNIKKFQVANDAPGVTVKTHGIQPVPFFACRGQPDLLTENDRRRPTAA